MTENKQINTNIWHEPTERPEDRPIIEHWKNKLGRDCYNLWYVSCAAQLDANTVRWAYLKDLIASSKALDVANSAIQVALNFSDSESTLIEILHTAQKEIESIMKGNTTCQEN